MGDKAVRAHPMGAWQLRAGVGNGSSQAEDGAGLLDGVRHAGQAACGLHLGDELLLLRCGLGAIGPPCRG